MKYYLAPLEGITTYVYRNAYHKYFRPMDKYFTPFIVPHKDKRFNTRELKELSPEHNNGLHVVPQLLTNKQESEESLRMNSIDCLRFITNIQLKN